MIIPLGRPLLTGSSDLPGSLNGAGRSYSPIWSCSAWGLPCQSALLRTAVRSYRTFSPLPNL